MPNRPHFFPPSAFFLLIAALSLSLSAADGSWRLATVEAQPDGSHRIQLSRETPTNRLAGPGFFRVITASTWPAGLVPIFAVEREGRLELRRRPPAGQENITDPLFFAFPPLGNTDAARLAGRWQIQSTNEYGDRNWTFFELTAERERVAGRFDQNTDYRFAFINGGTWRSNRLTLDIEYIQDRYQLEAEWKDGRLSGTWRRPDDSERGHWAGTRPEPDSGVPEVERSVPLWEWRRVTDGARRYGLDPELSLDGWERMPEPLCRVWLP